MTTKVVEIFHPVMPEVKAKLLGSYKVVRLKYNLLKLPHSGFLITESLSAQQLIKVATLFRSIEKYNVVITLKSFCFARNTSQPGTDCHSDYYLIN